MASFYNHPMDLEDHPPHRRSCLGKSIYSIGRVNYRVGDKSLSVYALGQPVRPLDTEEAEFLNRGKESTSPMLEEMAEDAGTPKGKPQPPLAYWLPRAGGVVDTLAVLVGTDQDGGPLFVGRAYVKGDLVPGKISQRHRVCYVAHEGRELAFSRYEVLVLERGKVEWVPCKNGAYPLHAVSAGITLQGKRCYAVRSAINDVVTPGRLVAGEKFCRISFDMKEFFIDEYEVLTIRPMDPREHNGMVRYTSHENVQFSPEPDSSESDFDDDHFSGDDFDEMDMDDDDVEIDEGVAEFDQYLQLHIAQDYANQGFAPDSDSEEDDGNNDNHAGNNEVNNDNPNQNA